jgi:hypothetical protein
MDVVERRRELEARINGLQDLRAARVEHGHRTAVAASRDWLASLQPKQAQAEAAAATVDELLYGGAAGGGKTHWLIGHMAREMERWPGNRGLIVRRIFPSLRRSIIPRATDMLRGRAKYNQATNTFAFPNGSALELGQVQYLRDLDTYWGSEYGVIAFEELTEFLEQMLDYLLSRLRAPIAGPRPHMIATTNPGGVGHRWVKRRYIRPDQADIAWGRPEPGAVWRPVATDDRPRPLTRCFIPARLEDNPALLHRDPGYIDRLQMISSRGLRRALRHGDWDAIDTVEGALWTEEWLDLGRVASAPPAVLRVLAVDPADGEEGGSQYGVSVCSRGTDGHGYVEHAAGWRMTPKELAVHTVELYHDLGCHRCIVERNHGGKWVRALIRQVDPSVLIKEVWASEGKRTRAEPVAALFEPGDGGPRCHLVGRHDDLEAELTSFTGTLGEPSPDLLDSMVWGMVGLGLATATGGQARFAAGMATTQIG